MTAAPQVTRPIDRPIITPATHPAIGTNIQGPSLIRMPDWVDAPLGRYHLYFADHKGRSIRLAAADDVRGPWRVHEPGALRLEDSHFPSVPFDIDDASLDRLRRGYEQSIGADAMPEDLLADVVTPHIASPDVHVVEERKQIVMYFHGLERVAHQVTRVAVSSNGVDFVARPEIIGRTYFRAFTWDGWTYGLAMPGQFYRSADGLTAFEEGPLLFDRDMRHSAVRVVDNVLEVFWTRVGDAPERILRSTIPLVDDDGRPLDWHHWRVAGPTTEILRPERPWEGADEPVEPSIRGAINRPVHQLRDPCLYQEDGRLWLLYAVAGESGIGLAELNSAPGGRFP